METKVIWITVPMEILAFIRNFILLRKPLTITQTVAKN